LLVGIWEDEEMAGTGCQQIKALSEGIAEHSDGEPQVTENRAVMAIK
jgi:hypothetical protein